ncbi:undecaprenyldiphospho-muramoylpentapeptide beta-N-acetylglucosaminyltransferase [candidate division WOR-3 bacterium JGI_Cruoil_03_44_89]|uniref:UDP-N-acetylglucosamine--N-acetylmuramyl-(pentapeptide) pyrophosphoryl-undecaprenol N-acetylglucosamine transferase n=1 Tax=candidate division WOR-3 bacterium JGI_Cruoil_03_44_89 TaxID=1973748 RepID=A0A235BQL3_UNCW3|nr:MAG: undecaprenyldiphospho-muramoylpentapeptide beta-N-acetylglucosaminyltransferase [candidate division WOR-3 bacterium JGI_Cruoil_03_44_89]
MKKVLIATGGTGGHIFVGVAVASELKKYGIEAVFSTSGRSEDLGGLRYYPIHARGFLGKSVFKQFSYPFSFILSLTESFWMILKERPHAVLGTGSYASVAPAITARFLLIPLFITEIDSIPGMATRFLSHFAYRVYISFVEAARWLPKKKTRIMGCPVRRLRVLEDNAAKAELGLNPQIPLVFVFGGSGGAQKISELMTELIPQIDGVQFLLSTGRRDYNEISEKLMGCEKVKIYPFISDMGLAYSASDLVVSRAGALTLAEIQRFKKPAILIPYPYATLEHQARNAKVLERMGCVRVIMEEELSSQRLKSEIENIIKSVHLREDMSRSFPDIVNGADRIARDIAICLDT